MPTPNPSPFLLKVADVESLSQSEGFTILRAHLAQHYHYDLCDEHTSVCVQELSRWLIIRDVLHALLVPIVELFDKACALAEQATRAAKLDDLKYVFSGHARNAFVWLQSFLSSEQDRDWCYSKGCPACVVSQSLHSDNRVQLLHASCLLSDVHYPFTLEGPTLPSFIFLLESLETALARHDLFDAGFFEALRPRAIATRNGIEDLIHQCIDLDHFPSQPRTPSGPGTPSSSPPSPVLAPRGETAEVDMYTRRSKIAPQQRRVRIEAEQWTKAMLRATAEKLQPGVAPRHALALRTQSLKAALKEEPIISVTELEPKP